MKKQNKISILILGVILIGFTSCTDFLTEKLPNQFDINSYYQNDEEAVKGLYGLYASVRTTVFGPDYVAVTDLMCDDIDFTNTDQARRTLNNLTFDIQNKYFSSIWTKLYDVVGTANVIIDKVGKMPTPTATSVQNQKMIIGEAKFIRAWAYYQLVQLWGKVPLVTQPVYNFRTDDIHPKRAEVDTIYNQILRDLTDAEVLNDTPNQVIIRTDITYNMALTHSAVKLLEAKTYLLKKDYLSCINAVKYLVVDRYKDDGTGTFALLDDYFMLYDVAQKANPLRKKEVIWEIESQALTGYNNVNHREFAPSTAITAVKTTGYQNFVPTTSLFEAFSKQPSDKRYTSIYRIAGSRPCIMKKIDYLTSDQNTAGCGEILLRFSDALLVYAEALNGNGQTVEAAKWINVVRTRAGLVKKIGTITTGDIKTTISQQKMQDTIIFERRLEFAHEGQRLFDLRRTGKLETAITQYNKDLDRFLKTGSITFATSKEITMSTQTATTMTVPFIEVRKQWDPRFLLHPLPGDDVLSNPNLLPNNTGY
jgi:starch-binding outer membrane protein, SusD/RagB family